MKEPKKKRERIYLNDHWRFSHCWETDMEKPGYKEENMEEVRLPHSNTMIPYNYGNEAAYQELMGYRMHMMAEESWQGKEITITFEGAAHEAVLFVNGTEILTHKCGYTAFSADISAFLNFGEDNVIALRLDSRESLNIPPFGKVIDYMTYGGVYREVYLEIHEKAFIKDLYVSSGRVTEENPLLYLMMELEGWEELQNRRLALELSLTPSDTEFMREHASEMRLPTLVKNRISIKKQSVKVKIPVQDIVLWDVENPALFDMEAVLSADGEILDQKTVRVGFREIRFEADGFYLNNQKVRLRGLDRHQCYPYVGYAMPASMQQMDADVLKKELGLNAVRTSHYPQSHHFYNRCDEIGLLVFTEIPGWQHIGDEEWKEQAVTNTEEMVVQYRNHPSIILWGVRINESPDDDEFYKKTNEAAHRLDPFRQTGGVRNFGKSHLFEDVYTYNDFVHNGKNHGVDSKSKITSDMKKGYLVSEYNGHMFPTKAFDCEEHRLEHALRHARVLNDVAEQQDIAGSFGWCMSDYHTHQDFGSGDRICYHGVLDMFRNPKMAAAVYRSQKDVEDEVVLEVSSSMDIGEHPGGFLGPVHVFTNADSVALYKNDELIGEFDARETAYKALSHGPMEIRDFIGNQLETKEGYHGRKAAEIKKLLLEIAEQGVTNMSARTKARAARLMLLHGMSYQDGVDLFGKYIGNWGGFVTSYRFEAVVHNEVQKRVTKEPVSRTHLETLCDHTCLTENHTYDVAAIRILAKDQNGNVLPYYQEPIQMTVEGPAELIGPSVISLKGGMGGTYLRSTGVPGDIILRLRAEGMDEAELQLQVKILHEEEEDR